MTMVRKRILMIDDDRLLRWSLRHKLASWDYDFSEAETGEAGLQWLRGEAPELILLDMKLPDGKGTDLLAEIRKLAPEPPVIMITAFGEIEDVVTAMRLGAYDFLTKPIDDAKLRSTLLHAFEAADLKKKIAVYREIGTKKFAAGGIVGETAVMQRLLGAVRKIAESETSIVLLQGESGTGKDLVAQTIHLWSRRREAPFLAINCSAIPENLLESELFGYEKGAFTDAKQLKRGLVELADEGTLFLDEIDSLSPALQAKLLRFLETNAFKRVGGLKDVNVDLRVIAATNQDLEKLCGEQKFRKDLFYRLNVCLVALPPLAERRDDILPLARHFISLYNQKFKKDIRGLDKDAERLFLNHTWPGNVRELKNVIERAMIFEDKALISAEHLPFRIAVGGQPEGESGAPPRERLSLPDVEKRMVAAALAETGGNISRAARLLGIGRDALRYKIKKGGGAGTD